MTTTTARRPRPDGRRRDPAGRRRPDRDPPGHPRARQQHQLLRARATDAPATMAAIAAALPCQWQAEISRGGEHEWLNLRQRAPATA